MKQEERTRAETLRRKGKQEIKSGLDGYEESREERKNIDTRELVAGALEYADVGKLNLGSAPEGASK
jgi:hypothetical protein